MKIYYNIYIRYKCIIVLNVHIPIYYKRLFNLNALFRSKFVRFDQVPLITYINVKRLIQFIGIIKT